MNTKATIKELANHLKQPIPYVTGFINICKILGLVTESGKKQSKGKGKSSTVYDMPVDWFGGNAPKIKEEPDTLDEVYDTTYSPDMDRDYLGDGYKDYLDETQSPCDADLIKSYVGESEDWAARAAERGSLNY